MMLRLKQQKVCHTIDSDVCLAAFVILTVVYIAWFISGKESCSRLSRI